MKNFRFYIPLPFTKRKIKCPPYNKTRKFVMFEHFWWGKSIQLVLSSNDWQPEGFTTIKFLYKNYERKKIHS